MYLMLRSANNLLTEIIIISFVSSPVSRRACLPVLTTPDNLFLKAYMWVRLGFVSV
ncbi:Uncharacterized protein dnm_032500 [Desulfonema magnum]|uniref:Uncharacterized protein n=1 Tax=Desulfonema magnum TaxID=45655 RepID=A0A975BLB7_9BACT|nr:Uncharacterized protein dnm_032500 [Desulfonema magnum]